MSNIWNNNTIEDEIQRNSLEYGVAVNSDRSIPDAKSGLKPVARRIIYDAYVNGTVHSKAHVKCASIVGDVMGRFHPHGDSSIYGALVRLSQNWIMRYPLIDGHGNFGNILGDTAASYRYTEARLSKIAEDGMLVGLKKKNVDFVPNYSETEEEPITLPAIFPNLLCNPNEGIGWAMGCSWAPHNLREVADAIFDYLDGKEPMLPGPDFPTGGIIINKNDIPSIMRTGHGSVKVRGKYKVDGNKIIFYEIPYGTKVEAIMDEISKCCKEEKIKGITDVSNDTDKKNGLQLAIKFDKTTNAPTVVEQLFAKTNLQSSFSYNQVALIGKTPTELNLAQAIEVYVNHNYDCMNRETTFDLEKAKARLEIVQGLLKALEDIDNIIALIKASESSAKAKVALSEKYGFTEAQAKAIVDMKLGRLAGLEKMEVQNENAELINTIESLTAFLNSKELQKEELVRRLKAFVAKYGDERRTELAQIDIKKSKAEREIEAIPPEKCVVIMTEGGSIKRIPITSFRTQKRNTKGVKTQEDITNSIIRTNTVDNLMIFTTKGKMYRLLVNDIPVGTNVSKGTSIKSIVPMEADEYPAVIYSIYKDTDAKFVLTTTKNGLIKKTPLEDFVNTRKKTGLAAVTLREGDSLANVNLIKDEQLLVLTKGGYVIRFNSTEVSPTGRTSQGVKAINLGEGDEVIATLPIRNINDKLAIFSANGYGKLVELTEFSIQKRAGRGVKGGENNVAAALVSDEDALLVVGSKKSVCINAKDISTQGRNTTGVSIIKDSNIVGVSKV